jgi:protein gp37
VPFFFKQWGGITPNAGGRPLDGTRGTGCRGSGGRTAMIIGGCWDLS